VNICELFIEADVSIKEAMKTLDITAKKILLIVKGKKLIGIITDGDIRRWILKSGDLNSPVKEIMENEPKFIYKEDRYKVKKILEEKSIEAIPVLNSKQEVIDIVFRNDALNEKLRYQNKLNNPVVIMAGGKGSRLEPYTKVIPKPLIPIGDIPIVERIINRFRKYGCNEFYMTVNYKKNMIKAYFNDIQKSYQVSYIDENKPLGTAGSLRLLKDKMQTSFFVSNCDILIEGDYSKILKYHTEHKNKITLVTSLKHYTIPYGVIELSENSDVKSMIEKPEYDFLVNTGMYILEPEVLKDIPKDTFYHITDLITDYISKGEKIGVYPVSEGAWLDMGEFKEMEIMIERLGL